MTTVACSRSMRVVVSCHSVITATVNYTLTESLDDNCSVQSVNACRSLVSQSPDLTTNNVDQLCRYSY